MSRALGPILTTASSCCQSSSATHPGRRRTNEDACCADDASGLFVVADGLGGYDGGEIASRIVVETLSEQLADHAPIRARTHPLDDAAFACLQLDHAIRVAHRRICARQSGRIAEMGSTVAALLLGRTYVVIAHVGDSRVYRWRNGRIERMTRDHTFAESGAGSLPLAANGGVPPSPHMLTRALGVDGQSVADGRVEMIEPGDRYLILSDGVLDVLTDEAIEDRARREPIAVLAAALVNASLAAGTRDNVTAVCVELA
ncbi:Serine/threonine phosphatase PrpC, regulation of stationary phase (plasmid) [Sandaracinus amylolyticus]|nr:protein phosphatase 2C domain-containing protein [Sandaracinus sp.]QRN75811.1 Serine/threonine specific protein phosphatase (Putative) [Sandaracinus sp.]UJR87337.1 Serine/threonine phosphatase PrpC, regulation of stationary phase [Sandaracinus amylolyticus]